MMGLWKIYINGEFMGLVSAISYEGACQKYCENYGIPTNLTQTGYVHVIAERFKYEI
jgi:hypothetical protein